MISNVFHPHYGGTYLAGESSAVPAALIDRIDQEPIEHGQHEQRHAYESGRAKPIVRLSVGIVSAQLGAASLEFVRFWIEPYVPFVGGRGRASDAKYSDEQNDSLGTRFGAQNTAS